MIAKLAVWGEDRESARRKLVNALGDTAVLGIKTNTGYLAEICVSPWFASGDFHTKTLEERPRDSAVTELPEEILAAAVWAFASTARGGSAGPTASHKAEGDCYSPFVSESGWRTLGDGGQA